MGVHGPFETQLSSPVRAQICSGTQIPQTRPCFFLLPRSTASSSLSQSSLQRVYHMSALPSPTPLRRLITNRAPSGPKTQSPSLPDLSLCFFSSPSPLKPLKFPNLSSLLNQLRLIKFDFMSLSPPNPRRDLNLRHFPTPQYLSDWLKPRLPSECFASWGVKPGTKNIHNLWLELSEGETSIADSTPPVRTVQVLSVRIIGKDNRLLLESHQDLSDGTTRNRNRPLSEKMKPNETPESALYRAVKEELGSVLNGPISNDHCRQTVRIVQGSYKTKVEERNSISYPGLPACYILHSIDAWVEGLPDIDFCTEEVEYTDCEATVVVDKAVSVKRHHWKWVSADSGVQF